MTVAMNPMTAVGAVSKMMKAILVGIHSTEKIIVVLSHNLGIFYLFYLGMSSMI